MRARSDATLILIVSSLAFGQTYTTYTIGTVAGGALPENMPGTSASLGPVTGVVVTGGGTFFTLQYYPIVLRLDASGGLTRVAGNGTVGYSGDNGPATSASLNLNSGWPAGLAVDNAGNLYIADTNNERIRKISNGVMTTVAGNGARGYSGDNGPATSAKLNAPTGVAIDSGGNLYIADFGNDRIRKVSNGVITTVAGGGRSGLGDNGSATAAELNACSGIAVDANGGLYIADRNNHRVRKVTNGIITTVAGNGTSGSGGDNGPATSAQLNAPLGVAVDVAGNLYIADTYNNVIRKISNGVITTVAGSHRCCSLDLGDNGPATNAVLDYPCGVAVDAAGNLLIADYSNYRIRRVSSGAISTIAGGGNVVGDNGPAASGQLGNPDGVAVDPFGNVYISDYYNDRVRKVSSGTIATVAGNGTWGFSGDDGAASSAQLYGPGAVASDSLGNIYFADTGSACVRKVSNGVISTAAGTCTFVGFWGDNGPATSALLAADAFGVAVDSLGNLYIADTNNQRIRKVSNGVITTVAGNGIPGYSGDNGPAINAQLSSPYGIATDASGNLYIAEWGNNRVRKVSNGVITTVVGNGDWGYAGDNGPAISAQLSSPLGVAVDGAGSLYVADWGNSRIRKVTPNGIITTIAGGGSVFGDNGPATSAQLWPFAIAVGRAGNLYVADASVYGSWVGGGNNRIRMLVPTTTSCTYSVSPTSLQPAAAGDSLAISLRTDAACPWAISSLPSWITYSGNVAGTGPAIINLVVAANAGAARSAVVSIAGVSVSIVQAGVPGSLSISAIANAASNLSGAVAPGEIVALYGSGLGPTQLVKATVGSDGLYDAQLAGTTVSFNGTPAPMIYTSATQVAAVVPYGVMGTTAKVMVTYQSQATVAFSVPVAASAPGVFTYNSTGTGQAAAINQDGITLNSLAAPAKVGDIITLYATGEGQTSPGGVDGKPASVPLPKPNLPVSVSIGGQPAQLQYFGGAPGEVAGLMQINAVIPNGIQAGNAVPVVLRVGNVSSQDGVTIAVH